MIASDTSSRKNTVRFPHGVEIELCRRSRKVVLPEIHNSSLQPLIASKITAALDGAVTERLEKKVPGSSNSLGNDKDERTASPQPGTARLHR